MQAKDAMQSSHDRRRLMGERFILADHNRVRLAWHAVALLGLPFAKVSFYVHSRARETKFGSSCVRRNCCRPKQVSTSRETQIDIIFG
jgi:hypothetical protein